MYKIHYVAIVAQVAVCSNCIRLSRHSLPSIMSQQRSQSRSRGRSRSRTASSVIEPLTPDCVLPARSPDSVRPPHSPPCVPAVAGTTAAGPTVAGATALGTTVAETTTAPRTQVAGTTLLDSMRQLHLPTPLRLCDDPEAELASYRALMQIITFFLVG